MQITTQAATRIASPRTTAIAAGVFYLISDATSVAAVILYSSILTNSQYIVGSGPDTGVFVGALFEVIMAFANIGTAVALFPVVKQWGEGFAIGYVGLRILESSIEVVGVIPLLTVVALRQHLTGTAGTDTATLVTLGHALVAFHNWTFLVGPAFMSGANTVLMAFLMYRSRLVPRFIPILGLVGGPLVFASGTAVLFGLYGEYAPWNGVAVFEFAWEVSLALWLIIRGFNRSALASMPANTGANE